MKHLRRFNESQSDRLEKMEAIVRYSNFDMPSLIEMSDEEIDELYDSLEIEEFETELGVQGDSMLKSSFKDFSQRLGIDPEWFADYLHECFSFNLDQSEMPFSDDEFEMILDKLESLIPSASDRKMK